jgi:hypothetical protein
MREFPRNDSHSLYGTTLTAGQFTHDQFTLEKCDDMNHLLFWTFAWHWTCLSTHFETSLSQPLSSRNDYHDSDGMAQRSFGNPYRHDS